MRVLIDAMCAEFGGIRTYVEHLLRAWQDEAPDDEVTVLVARGSGLPTPVVRRVEVDVPRPQALGRPWAQTRVLRRLAPEHDAALLTLPSTTVLRLPIPTAVTVYDLRHVLRPEQFRVRQRLLRRVSYARGYAVADELLAISQRSLDDLHACHPRTARTSARVTYLGADHVQAWPRPAPGDPPGPAIAFGHHSNKNLDLVLDTWAMLGREPHVPDLLMLGVGSAHRSQVEATVTARGLAGRVHLAPFLEDADFQAVLAAARAIVFPTDFEGFGLPVVEGMTLGIPVVLGPEPATNEVAGGHAFVAPDWSAVEVAAAVRRALAAGPEHLAAARRRGEEFTWARTVRETRAALQSAIQSEGVRP